MSLARWSRLAQDIAGEHGVYVALSQLVGFEGGKAFPGGSILAGPRGDLLVAGTGLSGSIIPAVLDFEEITRARADLPLLADLEMRLPHLLGSLHAARRERGRERAAGQAKRRSGTGQPKQEPTAQPTRQGRTSRRPAAAARAARRFNPSRIRSPSTPSSPSAGWSSSFGTRSSAGASSTRW